MRATRPLDALLSRTRQGILAATFIRPEKAWYIAELARRMGVPPSSLQRDLRELASAGISKTHRQGHMVYFQANTHSPIFPDLRALLLKTAGLIDVLADSLKPIASSIIWAFVYGSIARAQERSESDIDLMIIEKVPPSDLALPLRHARELLGREINPTVYAPEEFARKRAGKDRFVSEVLAKPRFLVLGNDDDLGLAREKE